jgi:hypothetical protein
MGKLRATDGQLIYALPESGTGTGRQCRLRTRTIVRTADGVLPRTLHATRYAGPKLANGFDRLPKPSLPP